MIREFWTENYLSIRDRQCLNFEATGDSRYWIGAEVTDGMSLNKVGVIFGPNASGKSNMLKALNNVFRLLFISSDNRNKPVCSEAPFALTADKPTRMYVSFYADNVRYDYTIVYTIDHIVREELLYYPKKSKSLFYERDYVGADSQCRIKFGTSVGIKGRTLDTLMENTLNNHSVLSTYGKVALSDDALKLANLYNWIRTHVHGIADNEPELPQLLKEVEKDPRKKRFFLEMLKKADFNITGFRWYQTAIQIRWSLSIHQMMAFLVCPKPLNHQAPSSICKTFGIFTMPFPANIYICLTNLAKISITTFCFIICRCLLPIPANHNSSSHRRK